MKVPFWGKMRPVLQAGIGQIQNQKNPYVWAPFGPRTTLYGPKIVGSPSLKAVHAHLLATDYTAPYGSKNHRNSYKPEARSSTQSDQGFRYTLNWQTRTQSFFIRTAESNQTELGADAITYFHNNSLLACVETNRIKTSCFEAMSNEK